METNILVVDDEREIAELVEIYLVSDGYKVFKASNAQEGFDILEKEDIHLVLLDIMMPGMDGMEMCRKIRETNNIPIIMLSAKSTDLDKIMGLGTGADDYVTKPFNPIEVLARVKSQLRRYTTLGGKQSGDEQGVLRNGALVLDDAAKMVRVDGEVINLTPIEYNILHLLMKNPGRVYSTAQIYQLVWNDPVLGSENTVAVHIRHLREKIEIDPANPHYLKVVWGLGYKMEKMV